MKSLVTRILLTVVALTPLLSWASPSDPPFKLPERRDLLNLRSAVLETSQGAIFFELFPEDAPWHVANFKYLADKGFYSGLTFHKYEEGYYIQGGDPRGNGFGGPGYTLPPEFTPRNHKFGILGMARKPDGYGATGAQNNPQRRSSGSQFYMILGDAPQMDGEYTIFGKIVDGFDTLKRLRSGDKINKLVVFVRKSGGR